MTSLESAGERAREVFSTGRRRFASRLIGRDEELEVLASAVAASPAVAVLQGEAGIGKTRLVTELAARPELAGRWFVVGRCPRIREPFPLGPIIDALRTLGDAFAGAMFSPLVGALRPLVPEFAELLPLEPPPLDDKAGERHRVFRALVEVFASLDRAVLVLEDLHWADAHTAEFVSYLLADPPPRLSLVLTFRGDEVDPALRAMTARMPPSLRHVAIALGNLDKSQTGALVAAVLGVPRVSAELAAYVYGRTSGLPFAIEEVAAVLRGRGVDVLSRNEGWLQDPLDERLLPERIRDSVLARVSLLSGETKAVAEAAAVLHVPATVAVLSAVSPVSGAHTLRALDEALTSGLLVKRDGLIAFRHPLAAQAVYESMPGTRQLELHQRAASALKATNPVPLGQLTYHLGNISRSTVWVDVAERAADVAIEFGDAAEAARLLSELLRDAQLEASQRGRLVTKLARAAHEALGSVENVVDLLSDALKQDLTPPVRGEVRFWLATAMSHIGYDVSAQRELLTQAVADLDERPALKAWTMVTLGIPTAPAEVPYAVRQSWLARAQRVLPKVDDSPFEIFLLGKIAMVQVASGDPAWRVLTDRILKRTNGSPRRGREVNAYLSVGVCAAIAGHYAIAHRLLAAAVEGVDTYENRQLVVRVRCASAMLDFCRGNWDGLTETLDGLRIDLAECPPVRIDVETVAGCLALAQGRLDEATHLLAGVTDEAQARGEAELLAFATAATTRLAVVRGDADQAIAGVRRFIAALEARELWTPVTRALPAAVQALVIAGKPADARALVARVSGELNGLDAPLAAAAIRHAQGFLAAGGKQWTDAAHHFLAAADRYEPLQCVYEAAQAREQGAVAMFEAGEPTAARTLRDAMTAYAGIGAAWDLSRAAGHGRQFGLSVPGRDHTTRRGYGDFLSPREEEVAQLAATGWTNKEIGAELFVSPNTVDKHLRAVYRKLHIRSRTALARHLQATTPGGTVEQ